MVFNSFEYLFFLPAVLGLYWLVRRRREQNLLLLVASYVFYGWWDVRFLGLMWVSTLTDYTVGRLLAASTDERRRKRIFLVSLAVNLGILGFFKYFNFFADSFADLLGAVGLQADAPTLRILLPVGISFYTFHGISYTFDVYRRNIEPSRSLLDFACFVAYFPQLVAGPIGRAHVQLPQFANARSLPSGERARSGLFLILLGLFKKVAIADALAPFVDQAFRSSGRASAAQLLVGMYAFALQIYGDFSGYSDIARGSSRLFGIELLNNFNQPYLSRNITAFWRTWHMSLSTWLRDYLYVPLGGNRGSRAATYRNVMLTMLIGGLWHGAAWTFVAWGGLHGLSLAVHRAFTARRAAAGRAAPAGPPPGEALEPFRVRDLAPALLTFHVVCLAWVFFRAASFAQAFDFLRGIVTLRGGGVDRNAVVLLAFAAASIALIDLAQRNGRAESAILGWRPAVRGAVFAAFVVSVILFSGGAPIPFIYFQF